MIMKKLITIFVLSIIYIAPTFALEKKDVNLDEDLSGNFLYCWEKTKSEQKHISETASTSFNRP